MGGGGEKVGEWADPGGEGFEQLGSDLSGGLLEVAAGKVGAGLDHPGFGAGPARFGAVAGGPADGAFLVEDVGGVERAVEGGHNGPAGIGDGGCGYGGPVWGMWGQARGRLFCWDSKDGSVEGALGQVFASDAPGCAIVCQAVDLSRPCYVELGRECFDGCVHGGRADPGIGAGDAPREGCASGGPGVDLVAEAFVAHGEVLGTVVESGLALGCCNPAGRHAAAGSAAFVEQLDRVAGESEVLRAG